MFPNQSIIHPIWKLKVFLKWILLIHLGILPFILSFHTGAFAQDKVQDRQRILNNIQTTGMSRVLVKITSPRLGGLSTASQAHQVVIPGEVKTPEKIQAEFQADQALAGEIANMVKGLLGKLSGKVHTVIHRYDTLPFVAIEVSMESLDILELSPEVVSIFPDKVIPLPQPIIPDSSGKKGSTIQPKIIQPQLSSSVNIIGANTAWSQGYTGSGWYVAILDTGIRRTHQFFYNKAIVEACFASGQYQTAPAGDCPNGSNTMYGTGAAAHYPSNYSGYDHGTHVSGIAAGKKSDGSLNGVAKDANIIAVNVFSKFPSYQDVGAWDSDIIKGLDYIYSLRNTYSIAAVNMSLGGSAYSSQSQCDSNNAPTKAAIDNLRSVGIATVIATGNDGYCNQISAPGCISSAVAVGASTKNDIQASFNNWNSSLQDLFAPGQSIYSSTGSSDTSFASWSGTSMATPHVTGAWAILRQNRPTASVAQILSAIDTTGVQIITTCGTGLSKTRIQVNNALQITPPPFGLPSPLDYDGDGKADIAIWRPSNGMWTIIRSSDGGTTSVQWGMFDDIPVPGDYDGDGKADIAIWRPSNGTWYILRSSDGGMTSWQWGSAKDYPVAGDYDKDGKMDIAVWRASNGMWYIIRSSDGGMTVIQWGSSIDEPVPGDYDGDGKTDIGIWRSTDANWYIARSSDGGTTRVQWEAVRGYYLVPRDYDGDGKTDIAIWRPSNGTWYILRSSDGGTTMVQWGMIDDVSVPGDYDGDGKADIAVWRPSNGTWYILRSSDGGMTSRQLGSGTDVPITR